MMAEFNTISEMFLNVSQEHGDRDLYGYKEHGQWKTLSYRQVRETTELIAYGLASLGIDRGDRVAILSNNSPRWAMSDYAIICLGAVTVTVYPTLTERQVRFILDDSESKAILVEDREQADKVLTFFEDSEYLKDIILMNDEDLDREGTHTFTSVVEKGKTFKDSADFQFEERAKSAKPDDLLTLIYTSGTTGDPKGVMLTHDNLVSNIQAAVEIVPINKDDVFLSFLPLSHGFERMAGHFTGFSVGGTIYYAESIDSVAENIPEVRPTVMTSVPRLYEKMHARVLDKVAGDPPLRQKIFWWAVGVGRRAVGYRQRNKPLPSGLKIKFSLANKLVFSKLKERLGGRLRFFISGAAPLPREIGEFFASSDIIILEGYGLTETSPLMTVNRLDDFRFGSVGKPVSRVEVKIAEDGEILNRGPNTMKGYFRNDEATREAIDDDGWFHTGDIGHFDEEGFLRITDRKKNLLVTSGGKNVAPSPLENALSSSKYVEQCMVIGDRRKFISALIVPSFESVEAYAKEKGIGYDSREELVQNPDIVALFQGVVDSAMEDFAQFEKVKKFALLPRKWTIAGNELTPTLKVKRKVVEEKYRQVIEGIYEAKS
ncbi:MAG: AMP-dependent synthetase/ligase [Fidelibacterota bacterium]